MAAKTNGISFPIWICSNGYALGINAWGVFSHISFGIVLTGYKSRLRTGGVFHYKSHRKGDIKLASVLQQYRQLVDITALQITGSYQSWTDFLTTAARVYKYPYHEQLMIYAQRPEATACADYELWNKRMGRYVRRGAKGIALIDHSGDAPKLKYVFDVADTRTTERSRSPYLWEYRLEHEQVVSAAMEEQYNIQYPGNLVDHLEQISSVKVTEYFLAHQQDILDIVDGLQ